MGEKIVCDTDSSVRGEEADVINGVRGKLSPERERRVGGVWVLRREEDIGCTTKTQQ